ncbi:hypothetical protein BJV77DRAFT_558588 [Russula vinacea]|nr:hypothetical protein BJV77DRAFT_558588 [Russula vinacea]
MYRRWRDVMFASPRRISPSSSDLTAHATVLLRPRRTPRWSSWCSEAARATDGPWLANQPLHRSFAAGATARSTFSRRRYFAKNFNNRVVDHVIFDIAHRQHCASEAGPGARIRVTMIVKVRLESKSSCARSWVYARRPCGRRSRLYSSARVSAAQRAPAMV